MTYTLYVDESGDHGLHNINPVSPVFVLCGVLFSETSYELCRTQLNALKESIWGNKKVIFHSRDIRKCEKEFQVLFDLAIKQQFYEGINQIMTEKHHTVIASAIKKERYVQQYGKLVDDVYEIALSFIVERAIFWLDDLRQPDARLAIVLEKRGKKEDGKLKEHFNKLLARGTGYVEANRLKAYNITIDFCDKKENINGLQMADLIAYPVAQHVIDPTRANPAFEVIKPRIYAKYGKQYGLKVFP
ncbi:DUF3800 domain-containing protein [Fibrella aquatica]|uniref:DUF3800 domain-containing protein n=1 Tax=Fibrella aquatica TaxID=3242487 RepID=UPI00351FD336